jgi:GT2 family glycosyltransferase
MFCLMELPPPLSIVVVNYNTRELLLECIGSVLDSTQSTSAPIVVVDNASTDGSLEATRKAFPQVRTIANTANRGYGAACNQGLRSSSSPFTLLLNGDAQVTPEALNALWEVMVRHPRCGAAGCSLINSQGEELKNTWNFLNPLNQAFEQLGPMRKLNIRIFRRTHRPIPDCDSIDCSVDWIEASCVILRRAALDEVGLFDEQFFMYSEDEDLCLRLRKAGWTICYTRAGVAVHHGGASTMQNRGEMLIHFYSSQMRFLLKHHRRVTASAYALLMKLVLEAKELFFRVKSQKTRSKEYQERVFALDRARSSLRLNH